MDRAEKLARSKLGLPSMHWAEDEGSESQKGKMSWKRQL